MEKTLLTRVTDISATGMLFHAAVVIGFFSNHLALAANAVISTPG
jgi:hypothetical protein